MNKVAIIQARLASERLPGKALKPIQGKPMLWHVVRRVSQAKHVTRPVVATTENDSEIIEFCKENTIRCYAGSELDILDRTFRAARRYNADLVIRVWGDCPLIDPDVLDATVDFYLDNDYDYVYNDKFPVGLTVGVLSFNTLQRAWQDIKDPNYTHWFHKYFVNHTNTGVYESPEDLSEHRWTVDYFNDLEFVRNTYLALGPNCRMKDILAYVRNEKITCH